MGEEVREIDFKDFRIREEVLDAIAGIAVRSVEGVAGLAGAPGERPSIGKKRSLGRGIEVTVDDDRLLVGAHVSLAYGRPVAQVAADVQRAISDVLYRMTGWPVGHVEVFVDSIVFEEQK